MADDVIGGGAAAPPPVPPREPTPVDSTNIDTYTAQLNKAYQPKQDNKAPDAPQSHPVLDYLSSLVHAPGGDWGQRTKEVVRSVVRGATQAVNEVGNTIEHGAAYVDRKTGLGEWETPGFKAAYDEAGGAKNFTKESDEAGQAGIDKVLRKSDDNLANLAEGVSQFTTGMAMTAPLKLGFIARSAITDMTAFNPYDKGLAELAAKTGIPLLKTLGDHLSVGENDNEIVARIKRAVPGAVFGAVIDGVIHYARGVRLFKQAATATDAAEKTRLATAATTEMETAAKKSTGEIPGTPVANHPANPPHEPVVKVEPQPDGSAHIVPNTPTEPTYATKPDVGGRPSSAAEKFSDALGIDPATNTMDGVKMDLRLQGGNTAKLEGIEALEPGKGAGSAAMEKLTKAADEHGINLQLQASPFGEKAMAPEALRDFYRKFGFEQTEPGSANMARSAKAEPNAYRETPQERPAVPVEDVSEAKAQAATINEAVANHSVGNLEITPEQTAEHMKLAKSLMTENDPVAARAAIDNAHFNLNYTSEPDAVVAHIEALSEQFRKELDASQGSVPWEKSISMARRLVGNTTLEQATALVSKVAGDMKGMHAKLLAADIVKNKIAKSLADLSETLDARPHDPVLIEQARQGLENFYAVSHDLAGANSEVGRALNILKARGEVTSEGVKTAEAGAEEAPKAPRYIAGMQTRDIKGMLRVIRMAGGNPLDPFAAARAGQVIQKEGFLPKVQEFLVNSLLSGPRTILTIGQSAGAMSNVRAASEILGGLPTMNRALIQQGMDRFVGNFRYLEDNIRSSAMAFREGRSILNPTPSTAAIGVGPNASAVGRATGQLVRMPGRAITTLDEFSAVTNYRSDVYAKALRMGRDAGLEGHDLLGYADDAVKQSIDPATGIGLIPESARVSLEPTFKTPLRSNQWAAGLRDFTINHPESRLIMPFVKTAANIFDTAWQMTPGLNWANAEARRTMLAGGEDAAVLHARSAMGGTLWGYAMYQAMNGNITGSGPTDPDLRRLWLKDHQPYSLRFGNGDWHEYKRWEPWSTILGLAADGHQLFHEMQDKEARGADNLAAASVAAITHQLANKTYAQGMMEFFDAMSAGDPNKVETWAHNFAGGFVPSVLNQLNTDPTMREVRTMADAMAARTPGLSKNLDPRFNIFGEPMMKTPGYMNRTFNTWGKSMSSAPSEVEDAIAGTGKGLTPFPQKIAGTNIDLADRQQWANKPGDKSPWVRFNELLRRPEDGSPSLRSQFDDLVKGDKWKDLSSGTQMYPGGSRLLYAQMLKMDAEQRAMKQLREEYPKLDQAMRYAMAAKAAAIKSGTLPDAQ